MTARRGSSGGARGGVPDAPGAAEEAAEGGDAGDGDDKRLRAMRAVWLSMRDEAPPERGLAELLAAARRKAEDMAEAMQPRPTLWQRLLAAMRRPPVLALATAMVLIGGAVLIGRRVGEPTSRRVDVAGDQAGGPRGPKEDLGDRSRPAGTGHAGGNMSARAPAAGSAEQLSATPGAPGSSGSSPLVEPEPLQPARAQEATLAPAVHTATPARAAPDHPAAPRRTAAADQRPAPPVGPEPRVPSTPRSKDDGVGAGAADESALRDIQKKTAERVSVLRGSPSPPPRALPRAAGSGRSTEDEAPPVVLDSNGAGDDAGEGTENAKAAPPRGQPPRATLAQLHKQCESAASRGDCATVRRIVDEITRTDRGYRSRIAKDSALGKCLAE